MMHNYWQFQGHLMLLVSPSCSSSEPPRRNMMTMATLAPIITIPSRMRTIITVEPQIVKASVGSVSGFTSSSDNSTVTSSAGSVAVRYTSIPRKSSSIVSVGKPSRTVISMLYTPSSATASPPCPSSHIVCQVVSWPTGASIPSRP